MSLFFLLNPKHFLDPGGIVDAAFPDSHKKKKIDKIETTLVENQTESHQNEMDLQINQYRQMLNNLSLLENKLKIAELEVSLKEKLLAEQMALHQRRIEIGRLILSMQEEEAALLILINNLT